VATFLVDQALLRAGLSVNSARAVDLIPLAEQALRDVGVWLNCIHDTVDAPVHMPGATAAAAAAAAPPLPPPAPRQSPPPKQHQHQQRQQQQQHNLVLGPDLAAVEGFCEDVERQLQDCREHVAWLERPPDQRMRPTHPAPLRQHRVTQLLVKLRGAREQALERFAAHCVAWPNGPQKFPLFDVEDKNITDIKAVLGCSSPAELEVSLLKYGLCTTDTTGKACLRRHYPAVWAALEKLCSDDTTSDVARRKNQLARLTNVLKHGKPLDDKELSDDDWSHKEGPLLRIPPPRGGGGGGGGVVVEVRLLPFAKDVLADVESFVELCVQQYTKREDGGGSGGRGGGARTSAAAPAPAPSPERAPAPAPQPASAPAPAPAPASARCPGRMPVAAKDKDASSLTPQKPV
jgi:hypothetical protein